MTDFHSTDLGKRLLKKLLPPLVAGLSFILVLMFLCHPASSTTEKRRLALVIGNDNYQKVSRLEKAGNDAITMARELKAAGFEVTAYLDLNYQDMVRAIEVFSNRINGGDQVVVFFAGHGVQIKTGSYLLPIDIEAGSEKQVEKTAYGLADLTDRLSEAKASFALVVVDACRDNPLKSKGRSVGNTRGLSAIEPPKGQMVVYSASKGQQALDRLNDKDENPNGVFTRAFISRMKKPGVRIEDMMREVQDAVEELAQTVNHEQRPAIYNESRGNFYFFGPTTVNVQPSAPAPGMARETNQAPAAAVDSETLFWNEVKTNGSSEYFDAYLRKYPKGRYVDLARIELKKLDERKQSEKNREIDEYNQTAKQLKTEMASAEQGAWEQAKAENSLAAYDNYLTNYPKGKFANQAQNAKQKIMKLENERLAREEAARKEELARQKREAEAKVALVEQEAWEQAKAENSLAAYDNYLTNYPKGKFATQAQNARQKIMKLENERLAREEAARKEELARQKREAEAKVARIEQEAWEQAKAENNPAAYDNYLTNYPKGKFLTQARTAREKLLQEMAEKERLEHEKLTREKLAREEAARQEELTRQKREAETKAARIEQGAWEQAKAENSLVAYDNYLANYPSGKFLAQAQAVREKLVQEIAEQRRLAREKLAQEEAARQEELTRQKREAEARAARIEQEAWERAKAENNLAAYDNYLTNYPAGKFLAPVQAAREKILQEITERKRLEHEKLTREKLAREEAARKEELARQKQEAEAKAARIEQEVWEKAKAENSPAAYDNYSKNYPAGKFLTQAQAAREKIQREIAERERLERERLAREEAARKEELARQKREAEARAARIEQEAWEKAKAENNLAVYDNYLKNYPSGKFLTQAQAAREKIQREIAERERLERERLAREEAARQEELAKQKREAEARAARIEQETWEKTKAENDLAAYESYLKNYPKGKFMALAQANRQELLRQKQEEEARMNEVRAEQASWEGAKSGNTVAAYEAYLKRYPDGKFSLPAKAAQQTILRDNLVSIAGTLFTQTANGTVIDTQTGLEWVVGPDKNTDYNEAEKWIVACQIAGGGWRLPTMAELKALYLKGVDAQNIGQIFRVNGYFVWGEPKDWLSAWNFNFRNGKEKLDTKYDSANNRVFGVRQRLR